MNAQLSTRLRHLQLPGMVEALSAHPQTSSRPETARPRRVSHIEYADSLDIDDGLRIAIV